MARPTSYSGDVIRTMAIGAVFEPNEPGEQDARANGIAFSESGRLMATSHNDGVIQLFAGEAGDKLGEYHMKESGCRMITETHHDHTFLHAAASTLGHPCAVAYHNLHENKIVRYFKAHTNQVTSISMSPEADLFITTGLDHQFCIWDLRMPNAAATGTLPAPDLGPLGPGQEPPHPVASFDATGKVFAVALPQRGLAMYDATAISKPVADFRATVTPFSSLTQPMYQYTTQPVHLPADAAPGSSSSSQQPLPPPFPSHISYTELRFAPNENLLALNTSDRGILLLNSWEPGQEYALLDAHPHDVMHPSTISWSPDGRFLAVGGCDGHVWCYDVSNPPAIPKPAGSTEIGEPKFPYRPGFWNPPCYVMGERYKTTSAAQAAREGASQHREDLFQKMHKARQDFAKTKNVNIEQLGPPRGVPSLPVPLASSEEEQVSRHEGPVSAVRFHPKLAMLGSAGRNVALWTLPSPLPPDLKLS